jgi:hypothetical protein
MHLTVFFFCDTLASSRHDEKMNPQAFLDQLDLKRLAKRLVSEDGLKDEAFAHEVIAEYKKFFFLLVDSSDESPSRRYLPSSAVDLVWQRHMLDTFNYFEDCAKFDMPGGYCHRHELYSTSDGTLSSAEVSEDKGWHPASMDVSAQGHYVLTLKEYESVYGCAPREDIWPRVYDFVAQHEKRKVKTHLDGREEKCLSYAVPHALLPACEYGPVDITNYSVPAEDVLVKGLMWVGELVYDTLPLKQLKCAKGEAIGQISFEAHQREQAVAKVVKEYARFLLLVMSSNAERMLASKQGGLLEAKPEVTPSKLVDELWHAHILCSPAYLCFW